MSEDTNSNVLPQVTAMWTQLSGRTNPVPCLVIKCQRRKVDANTQVTVDEIQLEFPRNWKPGATLLGPDVQSLRELGSFVNSIQDSRRVTWEISQNVPRNVWTLVLSNTNSDQPLPDDWSLDLVVLLEKPANEDRGHVVFDVGGQRDKVAFLLPSQKSSPKALVQFTSDPIKTNALVRGQKVTLRWNVQNIDGDAELRGSLAGANTIRIANNSSGECSVIALGEMNYTLTAYVVENGARTQVACSPIQINLATPQYGLNLDFIPKIVFPGGPIVAYREAYEVHKIQFMRSGDNDQASLTAFNYSGKQTTIVDQFVVPYGPSEGHSWTLGATYASPEGEKTVQSSQITTAIPSQMETSMFLNLPCSFGPDGGLEVRAMAAGTFTVASTDAMLRVANREWIAIGTTVNLELWVRDPAVGSVKAAADVHGRKWQNNWLENALNGDFLGVGAANDAEHPGNQCIVAVRRAAEKEGVVEVIEIDLPLRENNPHRSVLSVEDNRFTSGTVRVATIGNRVFLFGLGAVISYERHVRQTAYRDEPRLAMVASPEWEIVGLAPEQSAEANGHLFALEKASGMLLRFDVTNGIVDVPKMAAKGNDKVAPLDKLQQAQASSSALGTPFPRELLEEGRGYTGKDVDGSISKYLNPIDERSSMVALGGILLVRSEVEDPSVGHRIQDRVYDPHLDAWARCGHPFGARTPAKRFFASTPNTLYCLIDDQLQYIDGSLPSFAGFLGSDYPPIPAKWLVAPPWPETFAFPIVENHTDLDVKWLAGRTNPELFEQGRLRLELQSEGETVITIEADVDRETGNILETRARVYPTDDEIRLCRAEKNVLIIEPQIAPLKIVTLGSLVLPFSYYIWGKGFRAIRGDSNTRETLSIPTVVGVTRCDVEFKYATSGSALDARAMITMKKGAIVDLQFRGVHGDLFDPMVEGPNTLYIGLNK